jgi:beta-xylosidase
MKVGHLFFDHTDNLRLVNLRYAHGSQMADFFKKWLEEYPDPYPQRYRKNIPFHWVKKNGTLLMTLTDGEVTYPESAQAEVGTRI